MSGWGSEDNIWGVGGQVFGALWLYINRDVPHFEAISQIIDALYQDQLAVLQQIESAFDLDIAEGNQLDILGAQVGLSRLGLSDERFRRAIRVRSISILSSSGTRSALLQVFEAWTGAPPLHYRNIYPNEIEIGGAVAVEDEALLVQFLQQAAPGGRLLEAVSYQPTYLIGEYAQNTGVGSGFTDYAQDPIPGAALIAARL